MRKIEAHLVPEHGKRSGSGAIGLLHPFGAHTAQ
jgi:hypothetical protein